MEREGEKKEREGNVREERENVTELYTPLHNLLGQSIRTSMRNLEAVAQKMADLLH